jgi:tetratricopeptide (TPR) repeat protein
MEALSEIRVLQRERRFDEALARVERLLAEGPCSTELLVSRARLLQLSSHSPDEADAADPLAPEGIEPRIELGYFLYAVRDRTAEALGHFEDAERLACNLLKDALMGQLRCLAELGRADELQATLADAVQLFPDDLDVGLLQAELEGAAEEG